MRISMLSVVALSGLSLASPVLDRRADAVSLLTDLYATIQTYTGAINATLAPLSVSSSAADKAAAVVEIGSSLSSITDALKSTTSSVQALSPGCAVKRSGMVVRAPVVETNSEPKSKRQLALTVVILLTAILFELFATISAAIAILGLTALLAFVNPLTGALGLLILAVEILLDVLLIDVIVLLDTLLTGLALALGGLIL